MSNLVIDIDRHNDWPMFDAWLNQVVKTYEQGAMRPETLVDQAGNVTTNMPSEAAISLRMYPVAVLAESTADGVAEVVDVSEVNFHRQQQSTANMLSNETPVAIGPTEAQLTSGPLGTSTGTTDIGAEVYDALRQNQLIAWFQDCYQCRGRIEATLATDISFPELVMEMSGHLIDIDDLLNIGIATIDSTSSVLSICALLQLGDWCIPDLLALKAVLDVLLHQYFLLNVQIGFDWWDLVSLILRPVLSGMLSLGSMSLQLSATPIRCIQKMLKDLRIVIETQSNVNLGFGAGLTLNQLQAAVGNDPREGPGDGILQPTSGSNLFSTDVLEALGGKTDWAEGDTLFDFSDTLANLSPVEVALLSLTDFNTRLKNIVSWLASKLEVLRGQNDGIMQTGIRITGAMLSIRRLNLFVDVIIRLLSQGRRICVNDGTGNVIPTEPLEDLFASAGYIPDWITLQKEEVPEGVVDTAVDTAGPTFTIIDTSLGTAVSSVGCLGRVSEEELAQVDDWINELDELSR